MTESVSMTIILERRLATNSQIVLALTIVTFT